MKKRTAILLLLSPLLAAQVPTGELKVRLTAPLTTKLSRAGDLVVARIVDSEQYADGYLEGEVREVHPGSATKRSTIDFQFHSLHAGGKDSRVSVGVVHIANSKHQPETDEDGASIESGRGNGSGGGGGLSRMLRISKGGGKEAAPGPPGVLTKLAAKAPNLSLAVGSELTVQFIAPTSK
jgi:hypothetical protein